MISLLAWAGFALSLVIQIGTFIEWAPFGGATFLLHIPCILLFLVSSRMAGIGSRKTTRSDCAGAAADLLVLIEPYVFVVFAWGIFATHEKSLGMLITLRMFSAIWMNFFLMSAGLIASRPLRCGWSS